MNERPAAPAEPATSNDIQPGPFSEHELREAWNLQADPFNQWDSLDTCEQLAWAQARAIAADRANHSTPARLRHCPTHGQQPPEAWGCPECVRELREELKALRAVIAADRAGRPAPAEPGLVKRLPDGKPYPTPPAEGEVGDPSDEKLTQFLFENFRGPIEFICDAEEEAHVMIRNHVNFASAVLARWGRQTAPVPAEGEAAELAAALQLRAAQNPLGTANPVITRAAALLQQQAAELAPQRRQAGPPVEGEAWSVAESLRRRSAQNPMGSADPILIRAAELLERLAGELVFLRREHLHG